MLGILFHRGGKITTQELGGGGRGEWGHAVSGHGVKPPVWVWDADHAARGQLGCRKLLRELSLVRRDDASSGQVGKGGVRANSTVDGLLATLLLLALHLAFAKLFLDPSLLVIAVHFAKELVCTLVNTASEIIVLVCQSVENKCGDFRWLKKSIRGW